MQKLIAEYLFQHKKCALLQTGTLEIRNTEATTILGEKKITAPVPVIQFTEHIYDATDLQNYIAANKNISIDEAAYQLTNFCSDIKALQREKQFEIPEAGYFYINEAGKLSFEAKALPFYFLPDVHAERVIHAGKAHAIRVGDTETTNAAMAEYYTEDKPTKKSSWWIWAAVLLLLTTAAVIFYLNDKNRNPFFGNSTKTEAKPAGATYRKIP